MDTYIILEDNKLIGITKSLEDALEYLNRYFPNASKNVRTLPMGLATDKKYRICPVTDIYGDRHEFEIFRTQDWVEEVEP